MSGKAGAVLSASLEQRLEQLAKALESEKGRSKELQGQLDKVQDLAGKDPGLTVLQASKDLWRGTDENRPNRPDSVSMPPPAVEVLKDGVATTTLPTDQDAKDAALAKAIRERDLAVAAAATG